jgi:hypothetical protein
LQLWCCSQSSGFPVMSCLFPSLCKELTKISS